MIQMIYNFYPEFSKPGSHLLIKKIMMIDSETRDILSTKSTT